MTNSKNKRETKDNFKKWIKNKIVKLKRFLKEYVIGKYRFLFMLTLLDILFSIMTTISSNKILGIISFILTFITTFTIIIFSHFIFLNKKVNFKSSIKAFAFFLINFLISFLMFLLFFSITILTFYNKLNYFLNLNNFTQQHILEMQKLNFYYSLFYPIFLIILFLLFYLLTFSIFFSVYYYTKYHFKEGLKKFWKDFLSKKNFFFFLFFLTLTSLFNQLTKLDQWFNLLGTLLVFPIIKYFHFIKESKDKRDFYLLLILTLILFIFNLLLLKL